MPKINVYLPDELAAAVKEAQVPVSAICQAALERAVRDVTAARVADEPPSEDRAWIGLFGRFTPRARQAVALAEQAARDIPHNYVGSEHVLMGVIDEGGNLALKVLDSLDIELGDLRTELAASMGPATEEPHGNIAFTPISKRVLELTAKESLALGHNYIGCEHLLLGLIAAEEGLASQVLRRMGVELRTTRRAVVTALSGYLHAQQSAPRPPATTASENALTRDALGQILERLDAIEQRLAG
jgi:ATP-dependent Clp protease ATP-binding subunit ClpC